MTIAVTRTLTSEILIKSGVNFRDVSHTKPAYSCLDVSRERNIELAKVLKCVVCKVGEDGGLLALIPGNKKLDMAKLRAVVGTGKIRLYPPAELQARFSVTVGAISPFDFMGVLPVFMDKSFAPSDIVDISSGIPTAGFQLHAGDLIEIVKPVVCELV